MINYPNPKVVLITGTTSGVGKSLQELYLNSGKIVLAINRRLPPGPWNGNLRNFICNISDAIEVEKIIDNLIETKEIPGLWILNAGINEIDNIEHLDVNQFKKVLETNLYGSLNFIQGLQLKKIKNVTVLTISSTSILVPNSASLGYYISKFAIINLCRLLQFCDRDNSYKTVVLGPTNTNLNKSLPPMEGLQAKIFNYLSLTSASA
nr:SDR family NAD(P)-dependent oxidoreductase [Bacteriovoracaceae bacterium]